MNFDQLLVDESRPSQKQEEEFKFNSFEIRSNFIKKVYLILSTQLVFTCTCIIITISNQNSVEFFVNNQWLLMLSMIATIAISLSLYCFSGIARRVPLNYILLFLFTAFMSLSVCAMVSVADPYMVLIAGVLTATISLSLTVYAYTTQNDLTVFGGMLYAAGFLMLGIGLLSIFIHNKVFQIIASGIGCLFAGVYIIYDTQLIVGGKRYQLEIDDYVIGALSLYVDIVYLFIEILRLIQEIQR